MSGPFVDFKGMRLLVSGASSGIGRAVAVELSRRGASVIISGRNPERLNETARLLESGEHHILVLDLKIVQDLSHMVPPDCTKSTPPQFCQNKPQDQL